MVFNYQENDHQIKSNQIHWNCMKWDQIKSFLNQMRSNIIFPSLNHYSCNQIIVCHQIKQSDQIGKKKGKEVEGESPLYFERHYSPLFGSIIVDCLFLSIIGETRSVLWLGVFCMRSKVHNLWCRLHPDLLLPLRVSKSNYFLLSKNPLYNYQNTSSENR